MSRKPVTAYEHWVQQGQPGTFAEWARLRPSPPSPSPSPAVPLKTTILPDELDPGAEGEPSPAAALYRGALAAAYGPQVLGLHGQWGPLGWFDV